MRIRKSCNCRGVNLNKESWKDFLFFELQQANKYQRERSVIKRNGVITSIDSAIVENEKIYAKISVNLTSVSQVEVYERPF